MKSFQFSFASPDPKNEEFRFKIFCDSKDQEASMSQILDLITALNSGALTSQAKSRLLAGREISISEEKFHIRFPDDGFDKKKVLVWVLANDIGSGRELRRLLEEITKETEAAVS